MQLRTAREVRQGAARTARPILPTLLLRYAVWLRERTPGGRCRGRGRRRRAGSAPRRGRRSRKASGGRARASSSRSRAFQQQGQSQRTHDRSRIGRSRRAAESDAFGGETKSTATEATSGISRSQACCGGGAGAGTYHSSCGCGCDYFSPVNGAETDAETDEPGDADAAAALASDPLAAFIITSPRRSTAPRQPSAGDPYLQAARRACARTRAACECRGARAVRSHRGCPLSALHRRRHGALAAARRAAALHAHGQRGASRGVESGVRD